MRKALVLVATTALAAAVAGAAPAHAGCTTGTGPTTCATFTVASGGVITIVASGTATTSTMPVAGTGGTLTIDLGPTTISDGRSPNTGWSLSATVTDFTTAAGGLIANTRATLGIPGTVAGTNCNFGTSQKTSGVAVTNGVSGTLLACTAISSLVNNSATYSPALTVSVPSNAPAGSYSGTVTQSVS